MWLTGIQLRRKPTTRSRFVGRDARFSTWLGMLSPLLMVVIGALRGGLFTDQAIGQERGSDAAGQAVATAQGTPNSHESSSKGPPPVLLVEVPLPIVGDVDQRVRAQIEKRLNELPPGGERPICVLEFKATDDRGGVGSQFERSLALARYLASERMRRVRTVAYLPASVRGHAVLPVLACEEIAVGENSDLGQAGAGETSIDNSMRESYRNIADGRFTIPAPVALGMLDRDEEVMRVELLDGKVRYVNGRELAELQKSGTVSNVETISSKGDLVLLTGRAMRVKYGFAAHLVESRRELASELKIPPEALREGVELESQWHIARVNLHGRVNAEQATRVIRLVQDRLRRGDGCLIVLDIDSPGGSPSDSLRLASFLAELDRTKARTCAFVSGYARCDAALPALACDDLVMTKDALLGGPGDRYLSDRELREIREPIQALAKTKQRDWSLMLAMVDPKYQVFACTRAGTGEVRYFGAEERAEQADPEAWTLGEPLETESGIDTATVERLGLLRFRVENFEQIPTSYGLDSSTELLEAGWFITRIEHLASQVWFSRMLLFIAFFALISEASTPGIGVAGFLSALCFMLFFWAQFLNGTAGWLEVLMFVGGLACVLIEILVLPGFGVFGIGGALMMILSLILASQTFVVPQNSYQMREMPRSMFSVVFAGFGGIAGILVMQRYLHQTPWLRNLALPPQPLTEELDRRESLVDFRHLMHKMGVTTTPLKPSGKARFGDDIVDVITEGEVVPPGSPVQVVEVRGNRILVRPIEST